MLDGQKMVSAGVVALSMAAGVASGQRSVLYEFHMTLTENNVTGTSHVGSLNGMPIGTPARLWLEASDTVVGTDGSTYANYQVLDTGFEVGDLTAVGPAEVYPTSGIFGSLGIGNDTYLGPDFYADHFVVPIVFESDEIASLATLVLTDQDVVDGERRLLDSISLPEQMDINLVDAEQRDFGIQSAQNNERVRFEISLIEATVVPAPATAAGLGAFALLAARRRR